MKKFSIGGLIIGIAALLVGVGYPLLSILLYYSKDSVGIIGGADSPTFWFWIVGAVKWTGSVILLGITVTITSLFSLFCANIVKKNCNINTTGIAVGLSAVGGLGLACFLHCFFIVAFNEVSKHPIEYPVSIAVGALSFIAFLFLVVLYCIERSKNPRAVGVILDILTSILYLPFFFYAAVTIQDWIS